MERRQAKREEAGPEIEKIRGTPRDRRFEAEAKRDRRYEAAKEIQVRRQPKREEAAKEREKRGGRQRERSWSCIGKEIEVGAL